LTLYLRDIAANPPPKLAAFVKTKACSVFDSVLLTAKGISKGKYYLELQIIKMIKLFNSIY